MCQVREKRCKSGFSPPLRLYLRECGEQCRCIVRRQAPNSARTKSL
jgi:hypothetical protein